MHEKYCARVGVLSQPESCCSETIMVVCHFVPSITLQGSKDLVQEVAKLRRSLDDAEGLSRDTRKEWAILRSQNISLEESLVRCSAEVLVSFWTLLDMR